MWCLFWIHRRTKGRTVECCVSNCFVKCHERKNSDLLLELIPLSKFIWIATKPKKWCFCKSYSAAAEIPKFDQNLWTNVSKILAEGMKNDTSRYIRFILNEDVAYNQKQIKQKKLLPNRREKRRHRTNGKILKLSKTLVTKNKKESLDYPLGTFFIYSCTVKI
jgi:hypothetical protein